MQSIIKALAKKIPPIAFIHYEEDPLVVCRLCIPGYPDRWYPFAFDGHEVFYGFVDGDFPECGSFRVSELLAISGWCNSTLKEDPSFQPCRLSELRARLGR